MHSSISTTTLEKFTTFGDLLRFLRRRAGITQMELAVAVGYSDGQISRLEQNLRPPDLPTLEARFISALYLEDDREAVARLLDLAANVRREDSPALGLCPYKGLSYFDENDADLFVGREVLVSQLADRVLAASSEKDPSGSRFLAIVGASGSGKSSLVRAGLIPTLRWDKRAAGWQFRVLTPSARPLEGLAQELTGAGPVTAAAALADSMAVERRSLHLAARQLTKADGASRILLVVDQFEELFTLCRSHDERSAFIGNLLVAAGAVDGPTVVVLALRADFYASCASYPQLREALSQHQAYIGAMNIEELRRAIEEPARRGRWEFEPGLVDLLLQEVGEEPGALPLLSHALLETWQRRRGHTLSLSGYASSGGVRGAIAETAEAVFTDNLTREQQATARRIFLRLTQFGDENSAGDTRRRASFEELSLKVEETTDLHVVLKALADSRLITMSQDAAEVAHEALIREWPRLRGWLQDDREGLRLHRQLSEAALDWAHLNREQEALYRGARLAQAREWAAANSEEMNALEREFLAASVEAAEREASAREAQRQHELEAARNLAQAEKARAEAEAQSAHRLRVRNRALTVVGSIALISALLAGLLGAQARSNLRVAQESFARAESLRLAGDANLIMAQGGDPQAATLLSILALKSAYSFQADAALTASLAGLYARTVLRGHTGSIYSVAFSPDGKSAVTGSQDGTAMLWDLPSGRPLRKFLGHRGGVSAVAYSPDGRSILTGGNDGTVRRWDTATGQQVLLLSGPAAGITAVRFSPDGSQVLSAGGDGAVRLWDGLTGQMLRVFDGQGTLLSDATFSPDGRFVLASSYDGTARIWAAASGALAHSFSDGSHPKRLTSAAFSPDGTHVLIGSEDHTASLLDADTGQPSCTFRGHTDSVTDVAFSPDGTYAATASEDQSVRLWDLRSCQETRRYASLGGGIKRIAFSPDGRFILAGDEDHLGLLLATPPGGALRILTHILGQVPSFTYSPAGGYVPTQGGVNAVAFSPDGRYVLTAGDDRLARLWDATTGTKVRDFAGHTMSVASVAFSPDGKYILTGSEDETAVLWNTETGQRVRSVSGQVAGVDTVAFLPDGNTFLTTGAATGLTPSLGGPTKLWNAATGQQLGSFNFGLGLKGNTASIILAVSPDGREALVIALAPEAILFSLVTGRQVCDFVQPIGIVTSVAISPDGKIALTGSTDGTAQLWDMKSCQQLRVIGGNAGTTTSVAVSPDGKYILTGHDDNLARLWDATTGKLLRELTGHTSWVTSVAFSPDGRYVLTGSEDGTARLWDTDYHDTIRFACSLLWRDLTDDERAQYGIADQQPACGQP